VTILKVGRIGSASNEVRDMRVPPRQWTGSNVEGHPPAGPATGDTVVALGRLPRPDRPTPGYGWPARRPPVDLTRIIVTGEVVAGAVAVAWRLARRPAAPRARVTMGPGGWVSLRGGSLRVTGRRRQRAMPVDTRRPAWARLLRAHRVT
jgi:hypothetical protein